MAPRSPFRATKTPGARVGRTVVGAGVDVAVGDVAGLAVGVAVADGAPYPPGAAEPGLPHAASSAGARISSNAFLIFGSLLSHRMVDIAHKNLSRERDIPIEFGYSGRDLERDWIDNLVEHWSALQPSLPVEAYHVTGRIARIAARLAQGQDEIFARYGLNRGDVGVLSALVMARPPHTLSPTQLFRGLMLSSAGMTKRLDRLERRGLVKRKPDPKDRRGVMIQLSESGRRLVAQALAENTRTEAGLLSGLSAKERRLLGDLLRTLLRQLEPASGG